MGPVGLVKNRYGSYRAPVDIVVIFLDSYRDPVGLVRFPSGSSRTCKNTLGFLYGVR